MDQLIQYSPILIAVLVFIYQNRIFVRPEELSRVEKRVAEDLARAKKEVADEAEKRIQSADFMTPADFQERRAGFMEYIAEHYVSKASCITQNNFISKEIEDIRNNLKEDILELKGSVKEDFSELKNDVKELTNVVMARIKQIEESK